MPNSFRGMAQIDKCAAYNVLTDLARPSGPVTLPFCHTYWRRKAHHLPGSLFPEAA